MPFTLREKLCSQHLNANGIGIASEMNRCPPNPVSNQRSLPLPFSDGGRVKIINHSFL